MKDAIAKWSGLSPEQRNRLLHKAKGASGARLRPVQPALAPQPRPDGRSPASFTQEQQWFLDQLSAGESAAYLVPFVLRLRGPLDIAALAGAIRAVLDRHEVLRSRFCLEDGEVRQVVTPDLVPPLRVERVDGGTPAERERAAYRRAGELAEELFDLTTGPLVRTTLLRLADEDHALVWIAHHAVADGTSVGVLVDDLGRAYRAGSDAAGPGDANALQYADFAQWQRARLTQERLAELVDYWRGHVGGAPPAALPVDHHRPAVQRFRGDSVPFELPAELAREVAELARRNSTSVFAVLLAVLHVVLARYSGEHDAVIGAVTSGRLRPEVESLIGPFATTVPLRIDATGDPTFGELLRRVHTIVLDGLAHQEIPFGHLVRTIGKARDASRNPLYQVLLSMDATDSHTPVELADDLTVQLTGVPNGTARLDLQLTVEHGASALSGRLDFSTDLFERRTAEGLLRSFTTAVGQVVANPDRPLSDIALLDGGTRDRLLDEWLRQGVGDAPVTGFLPAFDRQALATPDEVAVVDGSARLTYRELDERANRVAHAVLARSGGRGAVVAVGVERNLSLLPVIIGVLRSGSVYLPLDLTFPVERLEFMLTDSDARLLVHESGLDTRLASSAPALLCVDDAAVTTAPADPVGVPVELSDRAYVMYTSGSTGKPKGVLVGHRALGNFLGAMRDLGLMRRADSVIALTNITFDISIDELLLPLTVGAKVIMASRAEARDGARLLRMIDEHGVSVLHGTPATARLLVDSGWRAGQIGRVLCGGEALPERLASQLRERAPEVWNLYGPTEATVWSLAYEVTGDGPPPIGLPLANTFAFVLDQRLRPVPPGALGELYLGGAGLAEGYLNRVALTAERFVTHERGVRLYRTGDVASHRDDGLFLCHGRIDHQVKVRGFRIEPGEIEKTLCDQPAVVDAVAVVREHGDDRQLVAFVRTAEPVAEATLRTALGATLPVHMIPSRIVTVPEFPLTSSGKVDRNALQRRPLDEPDAGERTDPPKTATQRWLAELWAQLLGRQAIGVHDNFFLAGGHSLLVVKVLATVRDVHGIELSMEQFFTDPTVAAVAAAIDQGQSDADDDLLRRIESMTDEEVERLLGRSA